MDIVGMVKKDTIIRSKPTLDNTWQTGEIKAGTGVKITGSGKYGIYTFYLIGENQYVYGDHVQIIRDKEFYYKEYATKKLVKIKKNSTPKRGISYHLAEAKEETDLYDWLQRFNFLDNMGLTRSGAVLDAATGGWNNMINGSIIPNPNAGIGVMDIGNANIYGGSNRTTATILNGVSINTIMSGDALGIIAANALNFLDGLLAAWLGNKLSFIIGFNFSAFDASRSSVYDSEWRRARYDSGGSANTEQINHRQMAAFGLTDSMIGYFSYWDFIGNRDETYRMMNLSSSVYNRTVTSFYDRVTTNTTDSRQLMGLGLSPIGTATINGVERVELYQGTDTDMYDNRPTSNGYGGDTMVTYFRKMKDRDYKEVMDMVDIVHKDVGLFVDRGTTFTKFNRFRIPTLDNILTGSRAHIFFTRPDLNLDFTRYRLGNTSSMYSEEGGFMDSAGNGVLESSAMTIAGVSSNQKMRFGHGAPIAMYLTKAHSVLASYLTRDATSDHYFIPKLTDCCTGIDISDEVLETKNAFTSYTGWSVDYGTSTIKSKTAGTVQVSFRDDNMLSVYKMMKLWTEYINAAWRGEVTPKERNLNSVLDYAISIYYFLTDATDENILFYTKFTGCFPTNCPSSAYSDTGADNQVRSPTYNISFHYGKKDDYNPINIVEFNRLSNANDRTACKIYNESVGMAGRSFVGAPFVDTRDGSQLYKLHFRMNPEDK